MKKLFIVIIILGSFIAAQAQNNITKAKLSAFTLQYLKLNNKQGKVVTGYVYKTIDGKTYISALIKVSSDIDQSKLDAIGVLVGTKAGSIWTVQIPIQNLQAFTIVPGIGYIALDMPIVPLLDSARKQTRADSAQEGVNLPMPVTGKNVIMGIIDAGFDFNHPTMYDTTYSRYRINRVWAQKKTGVPPSGFSYGNELADTNTIRMLGYDTGILSHGTHVAGIAAGSGYASNKSNSRFRGMAFESEMVMVGIMPAPPEWAAAGESDIIDGMNYIFKYATSVSKPAVVNLSWGSTIGPHDGNSLFSQACDALTGAGKIFVCAAGNNGQDTVHLQKVFSSTDSTVSTFVTFSPLLDSNNRYTWVDIWGDTGKTFCVNIKLYGSSTAIDSTGFVCLGDTSLNFKLIGSNFDTCNVTITTVVSEYNGKPHALVSLYSKVPDNICLTTKATSGKVNMWEGYVFPPEGYYGYLRKLGYPWAVAGDVNMTVSDIGCTRSAITAGAYTSKTSFTNINGVGLVYPGSGRGRIAPFSSIGPTEDGRVKPDITAPGFALASSVSSYDTTYNPDGSNFSSIVSADTIGGRVFPYAMLAGTSMASPCVAGIVGMMLQVNPTLTPDEVKSIINSTAITDFFTGTLPASGSNTWGHGKINAYGAIKSIVKEESVQSVNMSPLDCVLFPNPNKGTFTINYTSKGNEQIAVQVFDISGRTVNSQYWNVQQGVNSKQFGISNLANGVYFAKVQSTQGYSVMKITIE